MTWTNEEVAASAPTVSIVDERGETISTVSGKDAQRVAAEYFAALNKSMKINESLSI